MCGEGEEPRRQEDDCSHVQFDLSCEDVVIIVTAFPSLLILASFPKVFFFFLFFKNGKLKINPRVKHTCALLL